MLPCIGSISGQATNQRNDADTSVTSGNRPGSTSEAKPADGRGSRRPPLASCSATSKSPLSTNARFGRRLAEVRDKREVARVVSLSRQLAHLQETEYELVLALKRIRARRLKTEQELQTSEAAWTKACLSDQKLR